MRINILLCDTFPGLLPHYIPSYVSMFTTLFDAVCNHADYRVYRAMDGDLPCPANDGSLCLITGCNQSAYDDLPWIRQLIGWVKAAHKNRVRLVGICFGHQLIAQALGGRVQRSPKGWGVGIRTSAVVDDEARQWFPDGTMSLLYNHHDQITALPNEATLVAESCFCPIDSYRIGRHILAFQGHPEYIPDYELHLLDNFAADEPADVKLAARQSIARNQHQGLTVARWIAHWATEAE